MEIQNKYLKENIEGFGGKFIGSIKGLSDVLGSRDAGCLATQLMYWHGRGRNPDGWIYKSVKDIKKEIWLSRYALDTAIKICKKAGILETKLEIPEFGKGPTMHFRLIESGINKLRIKYNSINGPGSSLDE